MSNAWIRFAAAAAVSSGLVAMPACLNRPLEPVEPRTTSVIVDRLSQSAVDKIDLLLTIDNSASMADKQQTLKVAVPDLVGQLLNPKCVDPMTGVATPAQPMGPLDPCPVMGTKREFDPIVDIHIGVVTSSLGSHGSDTCLGDKTLSENDHGHLIARSSTDANEMDVQTYNNEGFLYWDPDPKNPNRPPGQPQGDTDIGKIESDLAAIVSGAGEVGCGFENQLEGWYRFLVDPAPYDHIEVKDGAAVPVGTDQALLTQRKNFLRPDSLLAIIMLTDENDASVRDGSQYYFVFERFQPGTTNAYHLPPARAACDVDVNDPCCYSCGQSAGSEKQGCEMWAGQDKTKCAMAFDSVSDCINHREFDQKHRFGIDFYQPVDRYITGLSSQTVQDTTGSLVTNPIFTILDSTSKDQNIRDPSLVFLAGIVGVPWQDIARKNAMGAPDLINGVDATGKAVGGFQSGAELNANKTWGVILGDPSCATGKLPAPQKDNPACRPSDPLMLESVDPRTGANPVTKEMLAPPQAAAGPNTINGHEWQAGGAKCDLQYACISSLPMPKDCSGMNGMSTLSCDCGDPGNPTMNPLCDPANPQTQVRYKAYPGQRELEVLKALGDQAIVASICAAQQDNPMSPDFGFRPAVSAIIERLKKALGGQCLPRTLRPDASGFVKCFVLEARNTGTDAKACQAACSQPGRLPIPPSSPNAAAITVAEQDPLDKVAKWNCFCEIPQAGTPSPMHPQGNPGDLQACQSTAPNQTVLNNGQAIDGWCYIDATTVPPTGNPAVVANCPTTEKRIIRFVGHGAGAPGATLFITCEGE